MAFGASNRVNVLRDALQTRLWPVPTVGVLLAVALGVLTPAVDTKVDDNVPPTLSAYLFGGGADAARTVLSAIAGSLITVTSLTFSLTVVTLQLASSQFSPRLLRTFSRDPFVHRTLALFLGTFAYSLVVLRTVRTSTNSRPEFVPKISITVAVVLTLVSVFALVLFLDHLATQILVETMLDDVHTNASETVRRVLQKRPDQPGTQGETHAVPPQAPPTACPIEVAESGFLVNVDEDELLWAACTAGAVVQIDGSPGGSLVRGTPLGRSWPVGDAPVTEDQQRTLSERVAAAARAGRERTAAQDIADGLRQLTDVATKALSPGINDPTTACTRWGTSPGCCARWSITSSAPSCCVTSAVGYGLRWSGPDWPTCWAARWRNHAATPPPRRTSWRGSPSCCVRSPGVFASRTTSRPSVTSCCGCGKPSFRLTLGQPRQPSSPGWMHSSNRPWSGAGEAGGVPERGVATGRSRPVGAAGGSTGSHRICRRSSRTTALRCAGDR